MLTKKISGFGAFEISVFWIMRLYEEERCPF
jgi:hypothetical protein